MTRKFFIKEHPEYGNVGLQPAWMPDTQDDPLRGMGVAHDILEHGPNDTCEWQGLGGAVYVRGEGYFDRSYRVGNPNPIENIATDFGQLFDLWEHQDIPECDERPLRDAEMQRFIAAVVTQGCKDVRSESAYRDPETEAAAARWTRPEQQQRMRAWMTRGYRACKRRHRKYCREALTETFIAIERAVDQLLDREGQEYLGSTATISFDRESGTARAYLNEEY